MSISRVLLHRMAAVAASASTAAAAPAGGALLLKRGVAVEPAPAKEAWLATEPPGPYTTARTVDGTKLVAASLHIARMAATARALLGRIARGADAWQRPGLAAAAAAELCDGRRLAVRLHCNLRAALAEYAARYPAVPETRVTLLVNWSAVQGGEGCAAAEAAAYDVQVYVEPLPPLRTAPVAVVVRRRPPEATMYEGKDSKWVRERQALEAARGDANEVVLVDEDGRVLEGTQSNFYAVVGGTVYTAPASAVLPGSIRSIVLRACQRRGIPLVETAPLAVEHK